MENTKVIFTGIRQVELQQDNIPAITDDQFLVRTEATLISTGTELTCLEANVDPDSAWFNDIKYPMNPGYSLVGKIVSVGKNVPADYVGKRVFLEKGHAAYHAVDAECNNSRFYPFVPDGVPSANATFSALGVVCMASVRVARIRPGEVCVVFGAGIVGQLLARLAKLAGAGTVMVTDVSDLRLDKLPKDPCFVPFNSAKGDPVEKIKELTGGRGADVVFETTAVASLIPQQLKCVAPGQVGRLIITSSPKKLSTVDFQFVSEAGITIIGAGNFAVHTPQESHDNRWTRRNDFGYILDMMAKGQLNLDGMVTHEFAAKDAIQAYDMLLADRTQAMGVILNWEE
ncbi:MAG: zinc-binding alcohol dehydrogenase [Ruminococcaceae bacterium]|nr:zinc-binding alcohol dehydrogenase [Oscillospiraceae bacterium]